MSTRIWVGDEKDVLALQLRFRSDGSTRVGRLSRWQKKKRQKVRKKKKENLRKKEKLRSKA